MLFPVQQNQIILKDCVSLYVHIPFCKKKCAYCDFFSVPCQNGVPDEYISAVLAEIAFRKKIHRITSWHTVYIGGGTPSLLSPAQLERLCTQILAMSKKNPAEFTVEMNPDDVSAQILSTAQNSGVDRLSLGVQSLNDSALRTVSRRCSRKTTLDALELVKKKWNGRLSLDAIAGLPNQNATEFLSSLAEIVSFLPEHISLYSLMVEENTPLFRSIESGRIFFDSDEADSQWILGRDFLKSNGFLQYEVSNFAKPHAESLHNSVYWHLQDYVGAGSGATGSLYEKTGIRWTNTDTIERYTSFWLSDEISAEKIPCETETLSPEIQESEFLMMGFRLLSGINEAEFRKRFGKNLFERLGAENGIFSNWIKRGNARIYTKCVNGKDETIFALTENGILFLNSFLESIL